MWLVITTVLSKLNAFSKSRLFAYTVCVEMVQDKIILTTDH